ncbi:MAG: SDR family NAD(P)-dependent oxidoreductase, partial [Nitrospinaceae bacterium]|nr:SDR family NAD(P)-dependent oxidoreductase [Nitrospinaceae bacterium]
MNDFTGKVALVTGASRLIGSSLARTLGKRGASVVVNYFSGKERAERVAEQVEASGGRALIQGADIRDRGAVREMVDRAVETFGGIDILINNARHLHPKKPFLELDWKEDMCSQLDVHLGGAFNCCQEVIPHMKNRGGGAIVNLLSTAFRRASPQFHAYGPAKAALRNFTMNLAAEFGPLGIRVNSVTPGTTGSQEYPSRNRTAEELEARRLQIPLRRISTPEDVAE